jgi:hypothetical protein
MNARNEFFKVLYTKGLKDVENDNDYSVIMELLNDEENTISIIKAISMIYDKYFKNLSADDCVIILTYNGSGDSGELNDWHLPDNVDEECVYDLFNTTSELIEYDWYNNEGGQGSVNIHLATGIVHVKGSYNVITEEDASSYHYV